MQKLDLNFVVAAEAVVAVAAVVPVVEVVEAFDSFAFDFVLVKELSKHLIDK